MNLSRYKQQLAELVAKPSVSCTHPDWDMPNLEVVNLLASWLEPLGFDCRIEPVPNCPGKANLIASKGEGDGGLVLAGHTDTVPCNEEAWQQNPYTLTERENRLYGLGATDMKGFFPVVLAALEALKDQPLKQPVMVLATADEESSMSGARALANSGATLGRYAVIGEPTGMRPIRMHKGIMMEALKVTGLAGHSSNPALGKNALEVMNDLMTELLSFRSELQNKHTNPHFEVQFPTLNLGCIHGGDNPNRICQKCELHFDLRPLPGMENEALRTQIVNRLKPIAEKAEVDLTFEPLFPGVAAFEEPANAKLIQLCEELTDHKANSVAFATEAPFLQHLKLQTVVMGPGSIDQAHQPNEFIAIDQIEPAVETIKQLIARICL